MLVSCHISHTDTDLLLLFTLFFLRYSLDWITLMHPGLDVLAKAHCTSHRSPLAFKGPTYRCARQSVPLHCGRFECLIRIVT